MQYVTGKEEPLKRSLVTCDTGFFFVDYLQEAAQRII
jgi:hypothetical protein